LAADDKRQVLHPHHYLRKRSVSATNGHGPQTGPTGCLKLCRTMSIAKEVNGCHMLDLHYIRSVTAYTTTTYLHYDRLHVPCALCAKCMKYVNMGTLYSQLRVQAPGHLPKYLVEFYETWY
jgi:hypothetical protein